MRRGRETGGEGRERMDRRRGSERETRGDGSELQGGEGTREGRKNWRWKVPLDSS